MTTETKKRRRGCGCLWALLLGAVVICGMGAAMPALGICPPEGPWPTPPWCTSEINCVDYPPTIIDDVIRRVSDQVGAQNVKVANGCMFMRSIGDNEFQPFVYQELDYLTGGEAYPPVDRPITFGVAPADYWGNNYLIPQGVATALPQIVRDLWYEYVTLGTDPRKHNNIDNTVRRSAQIGAQVFIVEDFITLTDDDLTLQRQEYPGTESMTPSELSRLAQAAHDHGLEATLQLTLLDTAFYDKVADFFNSGQNGSLYDVLDPAVRYNRWNAAEDTLALHEHWRAAILEEARLAEAAGFDRLLVTPQGMGWTNTAEAVALDDAEWVKTIGQVRQVFSGKLGAGHFSLASPLDPGYTLYRQVDFVLIDRQIERLLSGLAPEDVAGMTAAWQAYLGSPRVMQFAGVPEVWQILIFSSYDGVLDNGWIEPGGRYPGLVSDDRVQAVGYESLLRALYATPDTPVNGLITWGYAWHDFLYPNQHEIRDDLGHSIRGKDAQNVFYRWTTIFQ